TAGKARKNEAPGCRPADSPRTRRVRGRHDEGRPALPHALRELPRRFRHQPDAERAEFRPRGAHDAARPGAARFDPHGPRRDAGIFRRAERPRHARRDRVPAELAMKLVCLAIALLPGPLLGAGHPKVIETFQVGPSVYVRALAVEPARGTLWVGTSAGLNEV